MGGKHVRLVFWTIRIEAVMPTVAHVFLMQNLYKSMSCEGMLSTDTIATIIALQEKTLHYLSDVDDLILQPNAAFCNFLSSVTSSRLCFFARTRYAKS